EEITNLEKSSLMFFMDTAGPTDEERNSMGMPGLINDDNSPDFGDAVACGRE
ncbi:hypothetical protein P7K49_008611, partial [Saguinus oedipus]